MTIRVTVHFRNPKKRDFHKVYATVYDDSCGYGKLYAKRANIIKDGRIIDFVPIFKLKYLLVEYSNIWVKFEKA